MSAPQPDEHNVNHDEVGRRDKGDVTPVGPKKGLFTPMTALMIVLVVLAAAWFFYTQLA